MQSSGFFSRTLANTLATTPLSVSCLQKSVTRRTQDQVTISMWLPCSELMCTPKKKPVTFIILTRCRHCSHLSRVKHTLRKTLDKEKLVVTDMFCVEFSITSPRCNQLSTEQRFNSRNGTTRIYILRVQVWQVSSSPPGSARWHLHGLWARPNVPSLLCAAIPGIHSPPR